MQSKKLVYTGVYSKEGCKILRAFINNLSWNGESADIPHINTWKAPWNQISTLLERAMPDQLATNEVVLDRFWNWDEDSWQQAFDVDCDSLNDSEIMRKIGRCIECLLLSKFSRAGIEKHKNDKLVFFDFYGKNNDESWNDEKAKKVKVKVEHLMLLADFFLGKDIKSKYSKKLIDKLISEPLDPVSYELAVAAQQELDRANARAEKIFADIKADFSEAQAEIRQEMAREYAARFAAAKSKYDEQLAKAKSELDTKKNELKTLMKNAKSGKTIAA